MQIIKDREVVEDSWQHLADDADIVAGDITVSFARWVEQKDVLAAQKGRLGIRVSGEDNLEDIVADLDKFALVVVLFPAFTDGRGYSKARLLRDRYGYEGEIRAQGDVLHDQLYYMTQCGINSFELANSNRLTEALAAFDDFSENYQTTVAKPDPLYRRLR
jgi:uncharacterized protein (DUF934 family)